MPATIHPFPCSVRETTTGVGVFATRDIDAGERVLDINGTVQRHPTRYSIQVTLDEHIECHESLSTEEMRARFPWRFLNHCCEPNASIVGRTLVARQAIRAGEQVTFDYTTTEATMAEPFGCRCGAAKCLGHVSGFLALTAGEQHARAAFVAPHLKSFLPKSTA
jgi:SET domain-containing protein